MLALAPHVQAASEKITGELGSAEIRDLLFAHFDHQQPLSLVDYRVKRTDDGQKVAVKIEQNGQPHIIEGWGNGPLSAFVNAWNEFAGDEVSIADYSEHALSAGSDASAIAFVQLKCGTVRIPAVATDADTLSASMKAIISAINLSRESDETGQRGGLTALAS